MTNWFLCLTQEMFDKYGFEWNHDESQEENCKAFINTVEQYGYEEGRFDERFQED